MQILFVIDGENRGNVDDAVDYLMTYEDIRVAFVMLVADIVDFRMNSFTFRAPESEEEIRELMTSILGGWEHRLLQGESVDSHGFIRAIRYHDA